MPRLLTVLSLSVTLGMLALGGYILQDLRKDTWRQAERAADNLVRTLAQEISRNITLYDLSLQGAIDAWSHADINTVSPEIRQMAIFGRASSAEYLGLMFIVNRQGDVVAEANSLTPRKMNVAEREHFQMHQQHSDGGLVITRPLMGRLVDEPLIALTRRINTADGQFGGEAIFAMRLAYFRNLFETLDIGPQGSVTLFNTDGRVIMRRPYRPNEIDRDIGNATVFRAFLDGPHGQWVGIGALDGIKRLYTFHRLDKLPLILSVAVAIDDIYAPLWPKAIGIGIVLVVLCGTTIALCLLFRREIQRRMLAENELVEAAESLSVIATTDALTGIANRRAFEAALTEEWYRAIRAETPLALLMLDADCFKRFNDHYGHQQGDDVLRKIAACIQCNMHRPGDIAARYGGEEFVVLLPETEPDGAISVAEAIRTAVADLNIPHLESPVGHVTISIGVAVLRPVLGELESLPVKLADEALYEAKRSGRDRVNFFHQPSLPVMQWNEAISIVRDAPV